MYIDKVRSNSVHIQYTSERWVYSEKITGLPLAIVIMATADGRYPMFPEQKVSDFPIIVWSLPTQSHCLKLNSKIYRTHPYIISNNHSNSADIAYISLPKLNCMKRKCSYTGIEVWNIRNATSIQSNLRTKTTRGKQNKWSLLRGGLYSDVVFQAGLTVFELLIFELLPFHCS